MRLVQTRFLAHEIGNEVHAAVRHPFQFKPCAEFLTLSQYLHTDRQRLGLPVVEQFVKALGFFKVVTGQSVLCLELVPVDPAFVNGLVAFLLRCGFLSVSGASVFLFHFSFCLVFLLFFFLIFRHRFFIAGSVHLVRGKQLRIGGGVFQQFLHYLQKFLRLVSRYAVEAEP